MSPLRVIICILLAGIAAFVAYRLKTLSRSGALAAFLLGAEVFGLGGLPWAIVLLVFFITSSGFSRLLKQRKTKVEGQFAKGSRRDAWQVGANGGVAGLAALLGVFLPGSVIPWVLFAAAFAAANADTWATELGVLSKNWPRSLRNGQRVPAGTSGAVSLAGTLAAAGGAILIALTAWLAQPAIGDTAIDRFTLALIIAIAGFAGSLVDSLLGATVQAIYWCPSCQKETEKHPLHSCGNETALQRGWQWMNNDVVNLVCTASAALLAYLLTAALY